VKRIGLVLALAGLIFPSGAGAHGGGVPGYTSAVTSLQPAPAGVTVTVKDGDDRLRLVDTGDEQVVVLGYEGEPYLRFGPDGVFRNANSPATYLNGDRYGVAQLPATADPKAAPEWKRVSQGDSYEWHDHRIHWMSPVGPPQVRKAPNEPHHVFDWKVPAKANGRSFIIAGTLDYTPPGGGNIWLYIAAPIAALALVAGVLAWRLRRRRIT
jgi:hypothetical protein